MIGFILPLVAHLGVPERFRNAAAYVLLAIAAIALIWAGWAILRTSIIREYEQERAAESIEAREKAAEERAEDTVRDAASEKGRNDAISAAPTGGVLSPAELSLNCKRLRDLGREPATCRHTGGD